MSNHAFPPQNNLYPQTSTFFSSKLERHFSNPIHSTSPSQLYNNSHNAPQNRNNHLSTTVRPLNFEVPTTNISGIHSQKLDFSSLAERTDIMNQTPNYLMHKMKANPNTCMDVEISDFAAENGNQLMRENTNLFDALLNNIEIPQKDFKSQMKPITKEKYLQPKKKPPTLVKRWKENDGVPQDKSLLSAAVKCPKNNEIIMIPDPLTHFTRSNSDVPPTLQSNLSLVETKEECLGDNKYLNNLKDNKQADKFAKRKQSDETFPGEHSNHKINHDTFQTKKATLGGKSKFAKNLFAEFNNDAVVNGGFEGGLFQIPEKPVEYDPVPLFGDQKNTSDEEFEVERLDPISKLLNFESESDDLGTGDQNIVVSSFDAEEKFFSPKKINHFETPTKGIDLSHVSTGNFNLFSTITAKKQSKSNLFSDLMNSAASVTDFSTGDIFSGRKGEFSSSTRKEMKNKQRILPISRFETDYEVLESLGSGDLGTVFKCKNKLDGLIYAIKCTHNKLKVGENNESQALNEAQALASLSVLDENPFIVRYYNAWIEDDRLYLAMEHCQNNLRKLKNEHVKFSESMIRQIMRDVCMGLKHLHSQRIVHLDIKPENILYSKTKKYKIADLGLSKIALLSGNGDITEGDCRYLAPELLSDFPENQLPDLTKADIFAFGATVFELITGTELPRNGREWLEIRRGNLHKLDHSNYSNSLKSIIKSMMSINAGARPSANELLTNFLQSEIELELKWEKKQNAGLKKQIKEMEDQLGLKRKKSM